MPVIIIINVGKGGDNANCTNGRGIIQACHKHDR